MFKIILLLIIPTNVHAASELITSMGITQQGNSLSTPVSGVSDQTTRFFQRFDLNLDPISNEDFLKNFSLSAGIETSQPDYSQTMIRQADGTEFALSQIEDSQFEMAANVGLNYFFNQSTIGLTVSSTLSDSPYFSQSVGVSYQQSFFEKTTILGLSGSYFTQDQPQSYYLNVDFQTLQRPQTIHGNDLSVSIQQVLSERWNAKATLSTSQRVEERPRNISMNLDQKYALFDEFFIGLGIFHLNEFESEALKNDRGYFTIWSGTLSLVYQPTFELELLASYSLGVEEEFDPRQSLLTTQGSDQYDLGARYEFSFGTAFTKLSYLISASEFNQLNIQGGIIWKL